jgi:signal transduction histidine kinase
MHPQISDIMLAGFLFLVSARFFAVGVSPAISVPIAVVMTVSLAFRRRNPVGVFVVIATAAFIQWLADVQVGPVDLAVLVALYTVAAYGRDRRATIVAGSVAIGGVLLAVARWHANEPLAGMLVPIATIVVALALGDDRRTRQAYFAELEERAERLERERDALEAVAASAERARIARELHDVVAHSLSVMVAQADGASYAVSSDPNRASRAMATVADTGRGALTEMRRLLGVLRPTATSRDLAPQPGVHEIPELVANVRSAGLPVNLVVDGHATELPAGMELAAYRIVQEALTNTLKHSGPGATAKVALHYTDDQLTVHVADDGAGIRQPGNDASGQGLAGMRERASMYGGTLVIGRDLAGGFAVTAQFPLHTATA